MISYVLVNESTQTDPALGGELTPAILDLIANACAEQLNGEFSRAWGGGYAVRGDKLESVHAGEVAVLIQDNLPAAPGAEGYHGRSDVGAETVFISRVGSTSLTQGVDALSVVISHELLEGSADPAANRWADRGNGQEEALETCDRVQDRWYSSSNGVAVSDFLLQAAFDPGAPRPYSHLDSLAYNTGATPTMTDGGYALVRSVASDEHQATPGHPKRLGVVSEAKAARHRHPSSRAYRRGLRA